MKLLLILVLAFPACQGRAASRQLLPIGAPCQEGACGTGRFVCADDHPGGYCVASCKDDSQCPDGSVCVGASALSQGACHSVCSAGCRDGYHCEAADASRTYCDAPGPRSLLRRIRSRAWR